MDEFQQTVVVTTIQIIAIPSCRVVYDNSFTGGGLFNNVAGSFGIDSNIHIPARLCARDSSKVILQTGSSSLCLFDLNKEQIMFSTTTYNNPQFATFSPSGDRVLVVAESWITCSDAETGRRIFQFMFSGGKSGFITPDGNALMLVGADSSTLMEFPKESEETSKSDIFFRDGSGRYIRPATTETSAFVCDALGGATPVELENSIGNDYAWQRMYCGDGDRVFGFIRRGPWDGYLVCWDAGTGELLVNYGTGSHSIFTLSADGQVLGVDCYGTFYAFDVESGECLAKWNLPYFTNYKLLVDRDVTKVVYVRNNTVTIFDIFGDSAITLDDYPTGFNNVVNGYTGQKTAISGDGRLAAVTHDKKSTLEIIDTDTGERIFEVQLGGTATTAPAFSNDGRRVSVGVGKNLFSIDTSTGEVLYSLYDENGFYTDFTSAISNPDFIYSTDDRYLLGRDIRYADTGEILSPMLLAQPVWEITKTAGLVIPVDRTYAVYVPTIDEVVADLRLIIRSYEYTRAEKLRFSLE